MTETDLSTWLPIADAAAQIGCSTRTIARLARAKILDQRLRPQAGSPAVAVYHPEDVAAEARRRRPAPQAFVLGAVPGSNGNGKVAQGLTSTKNTHARPADDDPIRQVFMEVLRYLRVLHESPPALPVSATVAETSTAAYVSMTEALAITGVSYGELRKAVQAGEIKQRGTRYRRRDLEQL